MPLPDDPNRRRLSNEERSPGTAASDSDPDRNQARPNPNDLPTQAAGLRAGGSEVASDFDSALDLRPSVFRPGEVVAERFRIVRYLARGGMGELYEAEDLELHERLALKTILPKIAVDERLVNMFKREVHLARQVTHANVCRIFDVYRHKPRAGAAAGQEVLLLAMELLHGENLADRLRREGRLSTSEILPLVRQMAAGLGAAHQAGVVHRDFKSHNVMLVKPSAPGQETRVVITDFGLARRSSQEERTSLSMSDANEISGTPAYMAPEQVEGGPVTPATDIYALGVVMYEMVAGVWPFVGDTPLQTAIKRLQQPAPTPRIYLPDLEERWETTILRCLERDPANRFASTSEVVAALEGEKVDVRTAAPSQRWKWIALGVTGMLVLAVAAGLWLFRSRPAPALSATDTVVVAEFANSTGDAVFDDTLKQGLAISLQQSPDWSLLSDRKVQEALKLMGRSPGERLTSELAQDVCQRAGSKAVISGSIASLGNQYVIGLNAINCSTGDPLAREQAQAAGKEKVLDVLGSAASKLRSDLGESLSSVKKFDVPLEQATTRSLEALKAFSLGRKKDSAGAVPFYERAIELDPNFTLAYLRLGIAYSNIGQPARANVHLTKAFELREHTSEREKLYIASQYYWLGTGELEKAIQAFNLWTQSYPRDWLPYFNLAGVYSEIGRYEKAVEATRESLKLYPDNVTAYENLGIFYLALNRFPEARDITAQALSRKLDEEYLHLNLYSLAFLQGDSAGMVQQAAWFEGKADVENEILALESATEAYSGRLEKARELTQRAVASAESAKNKESAALWSADGALREALFGNYGVALERAGTALRLAPGSRDAERVAALALALAGDGTHVQALTDGLNKRFPLNTMIQSVWLPSIRAQLEINRKSPSSAVELLQAASRYELGGGAGQLNYSCVYPVYIRGQAYLAGGQGAAAAAEFQKILDHRGLVQNCSTGALARLGLARAYAVQGDKAKAKAAYQDFLTLWKDADPDIPILKQAKAEALSVN